MVDLLLLDSLCCVGWFDCATHFSIQRGENVIFSIIVLIVFPNRVISKTGSSLTMCVDTEQNGVVSGESLAGGASYKTCARTQ